MRSLVALAFATLTVGPIALADEFDARMKQGFGHLRAGNVDAAVEVFRELQTEAPDSDLVQYSLAASKYRQGLKDLENDLPDEAARQLREARAEMAGLEGSPDAFVSRNAAFVAANCEAQLAKHLAQSGDHKKTLEAFREAIEGYEQVLQEAPDHDGARQNYDHMRYLLKKMLQNPPPRQEQSKQGDEGDEEQQEGEQQQQQPGEGE
ncbi:MAG: tetratricopeptide repeat protein, partial [Candidatus Hydrogenedentales bacterium]